MKDRLPQHPPHPHQSLPVIRLAQTADDHPVRCGGVDELVGIEEDSDVRDACAGGVEEDEISRLRDGEMYRLTDARLFGRRSRELDIDRAEDVADESGAVDPCLRVPSIRVGDAEPQLRLLQHRPSVETDCGSGVGGFDGAVGGSSGCGRVEPACCWQAADQEKRDAESRE